MQWSKDNEKKYEQTTTIESRVNSGAPEQYPAP